MNKPLFDDFTRDYIECALWSSNDSRTDKPLDKNHNWECVAATTLRQMVEDCRLFQKQNRDLIDARQFEENEIHAGHDFWLTRNLHGAGFWDGDWPGEVGRKLTDAAHAFGEYSLYVGDDGKIHGSK